MTRSTDPTVRRVQRESAVRGMLLGLALGDAVSHDPTPRSSGRRGSATTQLACFTTEGLIRAQVRGTIKGICHAPSVLWHAQCRWAAVQHLDIPGIDHWALDETWPDGWLPTVSALAEHRGTAPATVRALTLRHGQTPTDRSAAPTSQGHHALTKSLAWSALDPGSYPESWPTEFASYSHGGPGVSGAVAAGLCLLNLAQEVPDVSSLLRAALEIADPQLHRDVHDVLQGTAGYPPLSVQHALRRAFEIVCEHPDRMAIEQALVVSQHDEGATGVAPVVGALLGALHGVDALPREVWTLELGWVVDTLARDLVVQIDESRCGTGWGDATDPGWWDRYPGW